MTLEFMISKTHLFLGRSFSLHAAVCLCSYLDIQTLLSEPCRYEKNTAGRSERIYRKEGETDGGRETVWYLTLITCSVYSIRYVVKAPCRLGPMIA